MAKKQTAKRRSAPRRERAASSTAPKNTVDAVDAIDSLELYGHSLDGIVYLIRQIEQRVSIGYLAKIPEALAAARLLASTRRAIKGGNAKEMNDAARALDRATGAAGEYPRTERAAARVLRDRVKEVLSESHDLDTASGRTAAASAILVSTLFAAHRIGAGRLFPGALPSEPATSKIAALLMNVDRSTPEKIVRECVRLAGYDPAAADNLFGA